MNLTDARIKIFFFTSGIITLLAILTQCTSKEEKITSQDVKGAQNLIGVQFSNQEIDTLVSYLQENKEGYDTMRLFKLDYGIAPTLYFDPRPDGFERKIRDSKSNYNLPEDVVNPEVEEKIAFMTVAQLAKNYKQMLIFTIHIFGFIFILQSLLIL